MNKKSDLEARRRFVELDSFENFSKALGLPYQSDPKKEALQAFVRDAYAARYEHNNDANALIEYVETCGQEALLAPWVQNAIHWARVVLSDDFVRAAKLQANLRNFPSGTYLFDLNEPPLPEKEALIRIAKTREEARDLLHEIGKALARIGGVGKKRHLFQQEVAENKAANSLESQHTSRTLRYYEKAWTSYKANKQNEIDKKGSIDKETALTLADRAARRHLSRDTPAIKEAEQLYWKEIKRDLAPLKTKKNKHLAIRTVRKNSA